MSKPILTPYQAGRVEAITGRLAPVLLPTMEHEAAYANGYNMARFDMMHEAVLTAGECAQAAEDDRQIAAVIADPINIMGIVPRPRSKTGKRRWRLSNGRWRRFVGVPLHQPAAEGQPPRRLRWKADGKVSKAQWAAFFVARPKEG